MATFAEAVDEIIFSLHEHQQRDKTQSNDAVTSPSWSYICKELVRLMLKYPTGITKPVLLSELLVGNVKQNRPNNRPYFGLSSENSLIESKKDRIERNSFGNDKILEILETKQVNFNAVLECFIEEAVNIEGSQTRILKLTNRKSKLLEPGTQSIEMYLHQKIKCFEEILKENALLMTGLRLHKVQNKGFYRLLPTEYVVPVFDPISDKEMIELKFQTLQGIEEEEPFPHYTRNLLLTIRNIFPIETIHYPHGESAHRIIIDLSDADGKDIKLFLWDERTAFANLFKEEDKLAIEEPFLVKEDGDIHLEYGPATFFFITPSMQSMEIVQSQLESNTVSHLKKTNDGKLNYDYYQYRFTSQDIKRNSVNITILCTVHKVSSKKMFNNEKHCGHFFQMIVRDKFGKIKVQVFDEACVLHDLTYPGQMVLLENVTVDDCGNCFLKTWELGELHSISSLKGYISSPCLYKLTNDNQTTKDGHFVTYARIASLNPDLSCCTRVHSACLQEIEETEFEEFSCNRCQSTSLVAESESKDVSNCWKWRYSLKASLVICRSGEKFECKFTEQLWQELLQIDSKDFAAMDERKQMSALSNKINKEFLFSISVHAGVARASTFASAPESFLRNFEGK